MVGEVGDVLIEYGKVTKECGKMLLEGRRRQRKWCLCVCVLVTSKLDPAEGPNFRLNEEKRARRQWPNRDGVPVIFCAYSGSGGGLICKEAH